MELDVDVVVIGGGPTGENVADRAVRGGLEVVLVERELVGGECSFWACIPSKALLQPGRVVKAARAVAGASAAVTGSIDGPEVLARRDRAVHGFDDRSQVDWLDGAGIRLVRGRARLAGERRVEVEVEVEGADGTGTVLTARQAVVLCTGTTAAVPAHLAAVQPWTSREATSATAVPGRLAVVGGGPVACELAQAWRSLGSEVTLFVRGDRILGRMEPPAAQLVEAALRTDGIDVRLGAEIDAAERRANRTVGLTLDGDTMHVDELLVATGRRPATTDVGLDAVGLEPGSWLTVDDSLRVEGVDGGWLYAAGDVNHRSLLTHMGKYQARACGDAIVARAKGDDDAGPWSPQRAVADHRAVPQVVFTDPEVAAVGLTEAEARAAGIDVRSVDRDLGALAASSLLAEDYAGWARFVVDEERAVLVGATFAGPDVADLLHSATVAIVGEVPLDRLWHAVPSFPTISEVWLRFLEEYGL